MHKTGCISLGPNRLAEKVMNRLARGTRWSPIGERVAIRIDDAGDARLLDQTMYGTIRACAVAADGTPTDLLVALDEPINYHGHYAAEEQVGWLVTRPCLRWRRTNLLLLTWSAVRIIDAPSFVDATYDRTIATGRIRCV